MNELISVVINVYNGEKYIAKCLESVLNQTYRNIEIVIVNDGSTDDTLNICLKYTDERIKIINKENCGLSLSRNVGIDNCNGKYIYFVDADDYIEYDTIEYLYRMIKKYNVLIATCNPVDIWNYDYTLVDKPERIDILSSVDMLKKILLIENRAGTIWNKLIKKELFNDIRFEKRSANDVVVTYRIVIKAGKIAYSNQIKYYYLKHEDSVLGRKDPKHSIDIYEAMLERYENIKLLYPNLIETEISVIMQIMSLYIMNKDPINSYLIEHNCIRYARKLFSFKILMCKMRFRDKVKLCIFQFSPKLYLFIIAKFFEK